MIILRFFGAWQCLNLGGTVIYVSLCYKSCKPGIGLNFRAAPVIMKLPLQEARVERN